MEAVLALEVSHQGASYGGRYKTSAEHVLATTPDQAKSEELVNALLSQTLERLFADPQLQAFLSNL